VALGFSEQVDVGQRLQGLEDVRQGRGFQALQVDRSGGISSGSTLTSRSPWNVTSRIWCL